MSGAHSMSAGEQRLAKRLDLLRHGVTPLSVAAGLWAAAVIDWARVPWANMRAAFLRLIAPAATDPARGRGGYPVCETCQQTAHRACGIFDWEPPCGCDCVAAAQGRRAYEDRTS